MKGKMRKKRWVLPRCGFDQVVDLKLTKNIKGKRIQFIFYTNKGIVLTNQGSSWIDGIFAQVARPRGVLALKASTHSFITAGNLDEG